MNLAISRIRQIIPQFNEEALTEKDFWLLCEKENIRVVEANLIVDGFYYSPFAHLFELGSARRLLARKRVSRDRASFPAHAAAVSKTGNRSPRHRPDRDFAEKPSRKSRDRFGRVFRVRRTNFARARANSPAVRNLIRRKNYERIRTIRKIGSRNIS